MSEGGRYEPEVPPYCRFSCPQRTTTASSPHRKIFPFPFWYLTQIKQSSGHNILHIAARCSRPRGNRITIAMWHLQHLRYGIRPFHDADPTNGNKQFKESPRCLVFALIVAPTPKKLGMKRRGKSESIYFIVIEKRNYSFYPTKVFDQLVVISINT